MDDRVENLSKFKEAQDGSVPALVCTDLAARGLDLVVDHVIMFDFPYNPVSRRFPSFQRIGYVTEILCMFAMLKSWAA